MVVIISWHTISRKGKELISKKGFVHVPVGASTKGGASSKGVVNSHTNVPCVLQTTYLTPSSILEYLTQQNLLSI
jgi:hypothetical protein